MFSGLTKFIAGALALLLILWVVFDSEEEIQPSAEPSSEEPAVEQESESATTSTPTPSKTETTERVEIADAGPAPDTFRLLLVGASNGHPQIGASVRACPESLWNSEPVKAAFEPDGPLPAEILALEELTSKGDGVARLPVPMEEGLVALVENKGKRHWQPISKADKDEIILMPIADVATVEVRLVDYLGNPVVGVPVTVSIGHDSVGSNWTTAEERTSRDPDGLVFLPNLEIQRQLMIQFSEDEDGKVDAEDEWPLLVWTDLLFSEIPRMELPVPVPAGVIDFQLPPSGKLKVKVVGVENAKGTVSIWSKDAETDERGNGLRDLEFSEGELTIPYVGLGLEFSLEMRLEGESGTRTQKVVGPVMAGEVVSSTFTIDSKLSISGRFLDSKGKPITNKRVNAALAQRRKHYDPPQISLISSTGYSKDQQLIVDEEGNFRAIFSDRFRVGRFSDNLLSGDISFEKELYGEKFIAVQLHFAGKWANWTGSISHDPVDTNIGDMQLGVGPALISGRVLNPDGEGIQGASLNFKYSYTNSKGEEGWADYGPDDYFSSSTGEFSIPKHLEVSSVQIHAHHASYSLAQPLTVRSGAENIEVRMQKAGGVKLSCILPDGLDLWMVRPFVRDENGDVQFESAPDYSDNTAHGMRLTGLKNGVYTVGFTLLLMDEPIFQVEGVHVGQGTVSNDPRLERIDLSQLIRGVPFEIIDETGKPIKDFKMYYIWENGESESMWIYPGDDHIWLPTQEKVKVGISAEGFGSQIFENIGPTLRVQLRKPIEVQLALPADCKIDFDSGRLHLWVSPQDIEVPYQAYWYMNQWATPVEDSLTRNYSFPSPGKYSIHWRTGPKSNKNSLVTTITIHESDAGQTLTLTPPDGLNQRL